MLSKLAMIGTFYFGFWTFIYELALQNKPLWFALMSSALSLVLSVLCFMSWVVLDMWKNDPSTIPIFKIERERKKEPQTDEEKKEQGEPAGEGKKKKQEERIPLF